MREEHKQSIEDREKLVASIQSQIDRVTLMEEGLYDDKLAGEINQRKYEEKRDAFAAQKAELEQHLSKIDKSFGQKLEQRLILLELSQQASKIYVKKTPEQKRLIITKLFNNLSYDDGFVSVEYTNFSKAIAERVQQTKDLMGARLL